MSDCARACTCVVPTESVFLVCALHPTPPFVLQSADAQGSLSGTARRGEQDSLDAEQAALTPVLVDTLGALRTIPQESFKQHLKDLFPVLTRLIRCRSASVEMQVALSDLFAAKVGPLM